MGCSMARSVNLESSCAASGRSNTRVCELDWGTQSSYVCQPEDTHAALADKSKPSTFPTSSLGHLLINRQFFEEAATTWVRSKTFEFYSTWSLKNFLEAANAVELYVFRQMRFVSFKNICRCPFSRVVPFLPSLQSLHLELDASEFLMCRDDDKVPWLDSFTDAEIISDDLFGPTCEVRGLKGAGIEWVHESSSHRSSEPWKQFKAQVKRLLQDITTSPRETTMTPVRPTTFDEALAAFMARPPKAEKKANAAPNMVAGSEQVEPLKVADIPDTEDKMVRLFHTRPTALLGFLREARNLALECEESSKTPVSAVPYLLHVH